jgi:hypothetical protein
MKRIFCALVLLFIASVPAFCQSPAAALQSFSDVTATGSAVQVSAAVSSTASCRIILFVALPTNSAAIRVGDSNVGASQGIPIAAGGSVTTPDTASAKSLGYVYALTSLYFYGTSGDKLSLSCVN